MIKTITLESGKEVRLSDNAAFLIAYKAQFGREPLRDLMAVQQALTSPDGKEIEPIKMLESLELEHIYNFAWALAKVGNTSIKDPIKFYTEFSDFKPLDHIEEIITLALSSISPTLSTTEEVEVKN